MKFLICYDGSNSSINAMNEASKFIGEKDSVYFLHCPSLAPNKPKDMATPFYQHVKDSPQYREALIEGEQLLNSCQLPKNITNVEMIILPTYNVRETICEEAKKQGVNVIIVGNRGMGMLKRMVLGSTSEYLVRAAHCSVLVCRESATGDQSSAPETKCECLIKGSCQCKEKGKCPCLTQEGNCSCLLSGKCNCNAGQCRCSESGKCICKPGECKCINCQCKECSCTDESLKSEDVQASSKDEAIAST